MHSLQHEPAHEFHQGFYESVIQMNGTSPKSLIEPSP